MNTWVYPSLGILYLGLDFPILLQADIETWAKEKETLVI